MQIIICNSEIFVKYWLRLFHTPNKLFSGNGRDFTEFTL